MARKILIIDSSSMIAMRLKVLLELIGCQVELVGLNSSLRLDR